MKKVFVSVNNCKPGMKVADDIYNEYGAIVIPEGTILERFIIERISKLGIERIRIYNSTGEMIEANSHDLFMAQYNENLNAVKSVLHDISTGKAVEPQRVEQTTRSILSRINENSEIVGCINELRGTGEYIYTHSVNVALLCMLIGKWLKFDYIKLKSLVTAGFLHDVGKSKILSEILDKPSALSAEEYEEMKKHPVYGYKVAEGIQGLNEDILKGILMHHEREDGSGYPFGLKGEKIHEFAKIIAVADIYDAMTSKRVYRDRECLFDVIKVISVDNFGILDNKVASVFLKSIANYYIGESVRLNNGISGEIVYINPQNISRPIIKTADAYIDLSTKNDLKVTEMI